MKAILLDVNANLKLSKMKALNTWLNKDVKPQTKENVYIPKQQVRIQSTVDYGQGMTFNEKAEHIFKQIKAIK
jgi:hypothetical protein